ncbi:hypothetical protein C8R45DRAFT_1161325 [Mycena sanguinolenta]|nr:hypothetical protein C8R45DRAFT_1161325 [Mycena sanguinolenta]
MAARGTYSDQIGSGSAWPVRPRSHNKDILFYTVSYEFRQLELQRAYGCLLSVFLDLRVLASSRLESFNNNGRRSSGVTVVDSFARKFDMSRRIHLKSMCAPLLLPDLPVDIICFIFACCDIASVVSVAQVHPVWTRMLVCCGRWTGLDHAFPMDDMDVYDFAAEEADADVMIMICLNAALNNEAGKYVEIVNLDLQTGTHTSLLVAHIPDPGYVDIFHDLAICGSLAAVSLSVESGGDLYVIVNWGEKESIKDTKLHGALIPGHVLLSNRDRLHLISSDTLRTHWAPIIPPGGLAEFSLVSLSDISKRMSIEASDAKRHLHSIYAYENPIREGYYSVWIYSTNRMPYRDAFFSYRLSISANEELQWFRRTRFVFEPGLNPHHPITFRSHSLAFGVATSTESLPWFPQL